MQKYKEINGNDYVKDSRTTINETMQSIQSMNSGTAFPTNNLFEGMKCYRTDLKKTYTLTDVENNTWVEDAHASLSDEATHAAAADTATKVNATVPSDKVGELVKAKMGGNDAFRIAVGCSANNGWVELATADDGTESIYVRQYADAKTDGFVTPTRTATLLDGSGNTSFPGKVTAPNFIGSLNGNAATATKLQTPRTLSLSGKAAGSATFDGSANAAINVTSVNADTASKLSTARKINITGNASGSAGFDGTSDVSINVSVSQAAHADKATQDTNGRAFTDTNAYMHISALANNTDFNNVKTTGIYYCTGKTYPNRPHNSWGILTVYSIGTVKQEYKPDNAAVCYTREYNNANWTAWSKADAANADTAAACSGNSATATKLATARAISLTGNASGSATFDGSGNISINTNVNYSTTSARVIGYYTGNGGQQGPGYFGKERAGCLMSNAIVRGHSEYKNWLYMDNYSGTDVGGATAIGVSRQEMRAYIMRSNANRATWNDSAELLSSANYNEFAPTKTGDGASGTWGINITGNADSATNADTVDGYHASDIINRISAANTGGIVAASLTENGYVKFANGLILQWGHVGSARSHQFVTCSYPIGFNNVLAVFCTMIGQCTEGGDNGALNLNWYNNKQANFYNTDDRNGTGFFWFAIGN
jgi:hypothetical protein